MITHIGYVLGAGPVVGVVEGAGPPNVELVEVEVRGVESVEEVADTKEDEEVDVADDDVVVAPSLPETNPRSRKYWADGSAAMTSSAKMHWATTEPFMNWCVYAAMRFFESLTKTDATD